MNNGRFWLRWALAVGGLVGVPAVAFSQECPPLRRIAPCRQTNYICLVTPEAPAQALRTLTALLEAHGFGIERSEAFGVVTQPLVFPGRRRGVTLHLLASVRSEPGPAGDAPAAQRTRVGLFDLNGQAAYVRKREDPRRQAFDCILAVVQAYPGAQVSYESEQ